MNEDIFENSAIRIVSYIFDSYSFTGKFLKLFKNLRNVIVKFHVLESSAKSNISLFQ